MVDQITELMLNDLEAGKLALRAYQTKYGVHTASDTVKTPRLNRSVYTKRAIKIKAMKASGMRNIEICALTGLCPASVCSILRGKSGHLSCLKNI